MDDLYPTVFFISLFVNSNPDIKNQCTVLAFKTVASRTGASHIWINLKENILELQSERKKAAASLSGAPYLELGLTFFVAYAFSKKSQQLHSPLDRILFVSY
jgi:hypothetical protein